MAIDGLVVNVDTSDLRAVVKEMNIIGKNINQIARTANTYGIMKQDVAAIKAKVDEIWQLLKYMRAVNRAAVKIGRITLSAALPFRFCDRI